ncbi:MAG: hypothetical protein EHM24_16005 [Acidobacteria bacterium]|nr:MAG: hypothetical protein EHM24_16005 [Acidobacteriota bacterium]
MTVSIAIVAALTMLGSAPAPPPQEGNQTPLALDVVKRVALDPTTYAPAVVAWGGTRLDWKSSQIFFENGWHEQNPRFTVSGRGNDTPIGYAAGNRKILTDSVWNLRLSLINNVSEQLIEGVLIRRFPTHRRLLRTLGWIERIVAASYWTYQLSADHFRQWQANERRAQQLGYH